MTHRERDLLRFIEQYMGDHGGVAPTLAEMAEAIGLTSKSGVHRFLSSLERQGLVQRASRQTRSVQLVGAHVDLSKVDDGPLLAEVAARGLLQASAR